MSGDSEPKTLALKLKELGDALAQQLCPSNHWKVEASIGKGNWAAIPWIGFFDTRESSGAQEGVYPVIHFSTEGPIGIRIGLGVATTEFKPNEVEKAQSVWEELDVDNKKALLASDFISVLDNPEARTEISSGKLSRGYAKGMIVERFASNEQLINEPDALTWSLTNLLQSYKHWVEELKANTETPLNSDFLKVMRDYRENGVVFISPKKDARYFVSKVDESGCTVERITANESLRVTASSYRSTIDTVEAHGGSLDRAEVAHTVARQICLVQGPELCLASDRKTVRHLDNTKTATDEFIKMIKAMQTNTLYKPVILVLIIESVRDHLLNKNEILFDWLFPLFRDKMHRFGKPVEEQQLAEGFGRMASDLFWLLAHKDPYDSISTDKPTPSQIKNKITHARLHEGIWQAIQDTKNQERILEAIETEYFKNVNGETKVEENIGDAVEKLIKNIEVEGFVFQPWQIATFVTAIRTKPFVILAGVTGTGKSKLPALISNLTGGSFELISVRPDWTDSSEVLGYVDLNDQFKEGQFLRAVKTAAEKPNQFKLCIIDEMNLARVEHYFAEVLSTIENREPVDEGGYQSSKLLSLKLDDKFTDWQNQRIPGNLGIVGTVNMDESSHGFSRKVLDRAFTIELSDVDLDLENLANSSENQVDRFIWPVSFWHCKASRLSQVENHASAEFKELATKATDLLKNINVCLRHSQLQVGYRTRDEIVLFLLNAEEIKQAFRTRDGNPVDSLDLAIMMKILPRLVGGSNAIRTTLIGLLGMAKAGRRFTNDSDANEVVEAWNKNGRNDTVEDAAFPHTAARLCLMWDRLESEGFTSFWL